MSKNFQHDFKAFNSFYTMHSFIDKSYIVQLSVVFVRKSGKKTPTKNSPKSCVKID